MNISGLATAFSNAVKSLTHEIGKYANVFDQYMHGKSIKDTSNDQVAKNGTNNQVEQPKPLQSLSPDVKAYINQTFDKVSGSENDKLKLIQDILFHKDHEHQKYNHIRENIIERLGNDDQSNVYKEILKKDQLTDSDISKIKQFIKDNPRFANTRVEYDIVEDTVKLLVASARDKKFADEVYDLAKDYFKEDFYSQEKLLQEVFKSQDDFYKGIINIKDHQIGSALEILQSHNNNLLEFEQIISSSQTKESLKGELNSDFSKELDNIKNSLDEIKKNPSASNLQKVITNINDLEKRLADSDKRLKILVSRDTFMSQEYIDSNLKALSSLYPTAKSLIESLKDVKKELTDMKSPFRLLGNLQNKIAQNQFLNNIGLSKEDKNQITSQIKEVISPLYNIGFDSYNRKDTTLFTSALQRLNETYQILKDKIGDNVDDKEANLILSLVDDMRNSAKKGLLETSSNQILSGGSNDFIEIIKKNVREDGVYYGIYG